VESEASEVTGGLTGRGAGCVVLVGVANVKANAEAAGAASVEVTGCVAAFFLPAPLGCKTDGISINVS
jgi:hypothetical protein